MGTAVQQGSLSLDRERGPSGRGRATGFPLPGQGEGQGEGRKKGKPVPPAFRREEDWRRTARLYSGTFTLSLSRTRERGPSGRGRATRSPSSQGVGAWRCRARRELGHGIRGPRRDRRRRRDLVKGVTDMPMGAFCLALALAAVLASAPPARADYYDGQRAWDSKRYAEALAEWRVAASAGDARSMRALGRMYVAGLGVPQNYVEAHKWLNLAAARGDAEAAAERDALAAKMTPGQIASAQDRALEWRPDSAAAAPEAAPAAPAARAGASPAPPGPPPPRAIREAQELLAALGYAPGPADGQWGARTGSAYAAFLRDAGLPPEEALTPEALRAMREIAAGGGAEPAAAVPPPAPALPRGRAAPDGAGGRYRRSDGGAGGGRGGGRAGREGLDGADARGGRGLHAVGAAPAGSGGGPGPARARRGDGAVHRGGARAHGDRRGADGGGGGSLDRGTRGQDGGRGVAAQARRRGRRAGEGLAPGRRGPAAGHDAGGGQGGEAAGPDVPGLPLLPGDGGGTGGHVLHGLARVRGGPRQR